jgi:hypothetical protein
VSASDIRSQIPSTKSTKLQAGGNEYVSYNIPVTVSKHVKKDELRDCGEEAPKECWFNDQYRPVGAGCEAGVGYGDKCAFSLGPTGYHNGLGKYVILTAKHAAKAHDPIYQPSERGFENYIGNVWETGPDGMDAAIVDPNKDGTYVTMSIVNDFGGYGYGIYGMTSRSRINDMMENGEYLYHQGRRTGGNAGQIDYHAENNQYETMGYAMSTDGGDSGSIAYELQNNDEAYVTALHTFGYCDNETDKKYGGGECMYSVAKEMNLKYFDTT